MSKHLRTLKLSPLPNANPRETVFEGRDYLIVPVVALVEGVVHAMNADNAEYVPLSTLKSHPEHWNGRPVVVTHPLEGGTPVSANSPKVIEKYGIGTIYNARVSGNKLLMEAWIDIEKAKAIGQEDLITDLRNGKMTEVSVGAFVTTQRNEGNFKGKDYKGVWLSLDPNHLALLPHQKGACNLDMGCGTHRVAGGPGSGPHPSTKGHSSSDRHETSTPTTETRPKGTVVAKSKLGQVEVTKQGDQVKYIARRKNGENLGTYNTVHNAKDALRTPKNPESFPSGHRTADVEWTHLSANLSVQKGKDMKNELLEQLKALVSKITTAAYGDTSTEAAAEEAAELVGYRTLQTLVGQLETSVSSMSDTIGELIADETKNPTETAADEAAEEEMETARLNSINTLCMSAYSTLNAIMNSTYQLLAPEVDEGDATRYMAGKKISAANMETIQEVHDHTVKLGAECSSSNIKLMSGSCSCGGHTAEGGESMANRNERIAALVANEFNPMRDQKALEASSEAALVSLEAFVTKAKKTSDDAAAEAAAATQKEADLKAAAAATTTAAAFTTEQWLAAAPPEFKDLMSRQQAADAAKKDALVTKLKGLQKVYSEDELKAKTVTDLEKIASFVIKTPDYSARGLSRFDPTVIEEDGDDTQDTKSEIPDPYAAGIEALQAAAGKGKKKSDKTAVN